MSPTGNGRRRLHITLILFLLAAGSMRCAWGSTEKGSSLHAPAPVLKSAPKRVEPNDDAYLEEIEKDLSKSKLTQKAPPTTVPSEAPLVDEPKPSHNLKSLLTPQLPWGRFVEGWRKDIFRAPVIAATLAGCLLGLLGVFVVLQRMVFVSAAISQASACGVVLSYIAASYIGLTWFAGHPVFGAIAFGLLASILTISNPTQLGMTREALLGVVFLGASALSLALADRITAEAHDIQSVIFGHAVSVADGDMTWIAGLFIVVVAFVLIWHRVLIFVAFDNIAARVQRVPTRMLEFTLFVSIGVSIAVCTKILGALPVFAFSVLPAVAALALSRSTLGVLLLAALFGAMSGGLGYVVATIFNYPVGASQTVVGCSIVAIAALVFGIRRTYERLLGRQGTKATA
ncbi:MAG: metal ABC transporter permease [Myxococcales bacterium]|nr:metal ABC transporter permease [Myxococcales bacterium]